ncbi:MAG: radical SAM protein [Methanomicrobiales archaeon]|jgi:7-carboxy-7-deazaguanine synthase|nr:radical SAM protein [Methanomicrobiales archaeon]
MRVADIFRSLQGEGRRQGLATTFIRLAGCNLKCRWCDTAYARTGGGEHSADEVITRVKDLREPAICITGGEPLLQSEELLPIVEDLFYTGYTIEIETNGTFPFVQFQVFASVTMDVKCPSSGEESDLSLLKGIHERDTVKFVVKDLDDCAYAESVLSAHPIRGEAVLSPVHGADYRAIAAFILESHIPVRLQIQLHKVIGVP